MYSPVDLVTLQNLSVRRSSQIVLSDLNLTIHAGECWAVVGPIGSGKTSLLQAIAGQLAVMPGMITRALTASFVSFKEESSKFSYNGHFYQQRYHATLSDSHEGKPAITVRDYLRYTESPENTALVRRLGLEPLLDSAFIKLSNGQTRKARIGKALLQHPQLLLLDNPFVGLDATFRADLSNWLSDLMIHGLALIIAVEPDNLPPFITHVLALDKGRITWAGIKESFKPDPVQTEKPVAPRLATPSKPADFAEAFSIKDVHVRYGDQSILEAINWTVRANERWALMGRNGAGKSILLSLLYGDHPQAYANDIRLFGHKRGRGESIWDVKRRIGFVSPELHLYFPQHLTVAQVAFTGLTDTLTVPARVPAEAQTDLQQLLAYFGAESLVNRPFGTLSVGEQRLALLVRALLKNPPMLILDEPFQALDKRSVALARHLLDSFTQKTILFVTHDKRELPDSIEQIFDLEK
ncbi:ATP-binding cassette domain-containing protein [Spirosoma terrae]|uniref:ATP-binding cassette domain-containing protein n=1 Tax=Spirosoma terrae TaxID=1968276 RepID=A0A6L9LC08_9BACT|nr:ATP-binding cassette domain-containing protein [Spirosoma terrae]NDU97980.1 ATP-binding cassette domain-containing protein [Spirosoma terrae]